MSEFQICLCGAAPGYQHAADCPRPLYRASSTEELKWEAERAALKATQAANFEALEEWHRSWPAPVLGCPRCGHEWQANQGPPCPNCGY
jgi:rubrerythrin